MRAAIPAMIALLAMAGPAAAAWDAPERASRGPLPASSPAVAANARGDVAAAWVRGIGRARMVVVSVRAAGGAWEAPVAISRRGSPAVDPDVAVDAGGVVVVAWRQADRVRRIRTARGLRRQAVYVARARLRSIDDPRWGRVRSLSSRRQKVGPPDVATDDRGEVLVVWHWGTGTSPDDPGFVGQVQFAELGDGAWTGPRRLSRSRACIEVRRPHVAMGAGGEAVIWWQCDLTGGRATAMAVSRPAGGVLGPEAELPFRRRGDVQADLGVAGGTAVAVSAGADGTLTWWRGEADGQVSLSALAALSTRERIADDAGRPRIAVGEGADALSAWTDALGRPRATPIAADLGVGSPTSLDDASSSPGPVSVDAGAGLRGTVAWVADGRVSAAQRSAGGEMAAAAALSDVGVAADEPPALAVSGGGDAVVLWTRTVGRRSVVERASTSG